MHPLYIREAFEMLEPLIRFMCGRLHGSLSVNNEKLRGNEPVLSNNMLRSFSAENYDMANSY